MRFLHTADLHLGSPFRTHVRAGDGWQTRLRAVADGVLQRIVDTAIREKVDFVIIAGDLFDTVDVPVHIIFSAAKELTRLEAADIPVFMVHGNHDPLVRRPVVEWPSNVRTFSAAPLHPPADYTVDSVVFQTRDGQSVQISGFSYPDATFNVTMTPFFRRDFSADVAIGIYHGTVGSRGEHRAYCETDFKSLEQCGFDYWAFGHIHKPQILHNEKPIVVYPGNPQGRGFRETGPRGAVLVDVPRSGEFMVHPILTRQLEFLTLEIAVEGCTHLIEVERVFRTRVEEVWEACQCDVVIRGVFTGRTGLHRTLSALDATVLGTSVEHLSGVFVDHVEHQTLPLLDVEVLTASDTPLGVALRMLNDLEADDERRENVFGDLVTPILQVPGMNERTVAEAGLSVLNEARRYLLSLVDEGADEA